jgi:PIN domain nuclease of toxin-antitoxin system
MAERSGRHCKTWHAQARVVELRIPRLQSRECQERLPFPDRQHRDPFDRMIIVHARRGGLSVVGMDSAFDSYGIIRLW